MKINIAKKLMLYFAIALLVFSLIIGSLFVVLFRDYTIRHNIEDMERRAIVIASTVGEYIENGEEIGFGAHGNGSGHGSGHGVETGSGNCTGTGGFGSYLRFVDDFAMGDVWIVNSDQELLTQNACGPDYSELPQGAEQLINEAFSGKTVHGESFSPLLENTLTVSTPIAIAGEVEGVVLLHSPLNGMEAAVSDGIRLLAISTLCALAVAVLIAWLLSKKFTAPLRKINKAAEQIKKEDYFARTGVSQTDEIGELANTIDELAARLFEASKESKKYEQLRRDFISNVSHELRTPVTVIRGSVEALRDGVVSEPEKVAQYYEQMYSESLLMQRLVNDLLELSRLQNPDFRIEKTQLDLREVVGDVYGSLNRLAEQKGIGTNLSMPDSPCLFEGDYSRLRQMLLVVADNAVKFTPKGGSIKLELDCNQGSVRILLSDTGCGIASESLPYIFDRFHKGEAGNAEGSGLGLAIARQIAQRHGIEISITSELNSGTTALFLIKNH